MSPHRFFKKENDFFFFLGGKLDTVSPGNAGGYIYTLLMTTNL